MTQITLFNNLEARGLAGPKRSLPKFVSTLADLPWPENGGGKIRRGANRWYKTQPVSKMPEVLTSQPGWNPHEDSHLYLWVTNNYFKAGIWVMEQVGFRFIHPITWAKSESGIGQYRAGQTEHLLFGVRGKDQRPCKTGRKLLAHTTLLGGKIIPQSSTHSEKPIEQYYDVEGVSPGPYVELFARSMRHPGWHYCGYLDGEGEPLALAKKNKNGSERRYSLPT